MQTTMEPQVLNELKLPLQVPQSIHITQDECHNQVGIEISLEFCLVLNYL